MADLIVTGGTVIAIDPERRIIENGAVAISDGRIVAVGTAAEVAERYPNAETLDATGKVVLPGLIDVHAHAGHGLIKTMGMDSGNRWEEICGEVYTTGSTPEFWYAEARLAALERLTFGVTTGVSLLGGGDTIMRTDDPVYGAAHAKGVLEVGTRSVVAVGPTRAPHPRTYANGGADPKPVTFETQLETCKRLLADWHCAGDNRVMIALLYPVLRDEHERDMSPGDYAEAIRQAQATRALSREAKVVFTQDGHWRGSVTRAKDLGLLGPDALLSHAIDITAEEIGICADTQTRIAHNPSAVASIMGRCPAIELMEAGVTVGLGSDATAPDRSGDMFRHMQQAMHYHRRHFQDPKVLPPGKVLEMATIDAARALGLDAEIGSLEPGKRADMILVDMQRPHLAPDNMAAHRVINFANGNDVDTVIVGGEICLRNRKPTRVSSATILADAERETNAMIARIGAQKDLEMHEGFWKHPRASDRETRS
ncbi:amidohydrolase family protein [Stappia sp. ES.058]|uniref:amidohydrolase family protein n=1 Tax=Stappia sp. ES.058 TaxID=1881061 RepID=UPI00087BC8C6|nr:amidohydrolase family protein [Stappia sp. ES.058]SDU03083.1 Cytosine/adenosine deaminase [Stappia sp. ES.058]